MSSSADNQAAVEFNPYKNVELFSDALDFSNVNNCHSSSRNVNPNRKGYKLAKVLLMITVNLYDFVGLLEMLPCGTLHSTKPYISYKMKFH